MLEAAGIEPSEERVYRMLIGARGADVPTVTHRLDLDQVTAETLLTSLAAKGLVSRVSGSPPRFVPVPPDVALKPLPLRGQEALEWARRHVAQLAEQYRAGVRRHGTGHLVEVITGAAAIRQQLRNLAYGGTAGDPLVLQGRPRRDVLAGQRRRIRHALQGGHTC